MKISTIIPLILTVVVFHVAVNPAYGQVDEYLFGKTWIKAGVLDDVGGTWSSPYIGEIYNFQGGAAERFIAGLDSIISFDYKLKDCLILLADTSTFGQIRHLSADSMTVLIDGQKLNLFLPIKDYHLKTSTEKLNSLLTKQCMESDHQRPEK